MSSECTTSTKAKNTTTSAAPSEVVIDPNVKVDPNEPYKEEEYTNVKYNPLGNDFKETKTEIINTRFYKEAAVPYFVRTITYTTTKVIVDFGYINTLKLGTVVQPIDLDPAIATLFDSDDSMLLSVSRSKGSSKKKSGATFNKNAFDNLIANSKAKGSSGKGKNKTTEGPSTAGPSKPPKKKRVINLLTKEED